MTGELTVEVCLDNMTCPFTGTQTFKIGRCSVAVAVQDFAYKAARTCAIFGRALKEISSCINEIEYYKSFFVLNSLWKDEIIYLLNIKKVEKI